MITINDKTFDENKIIEFDVRPILENGKDPFHDIMEQLKSLASDEVLLIVNSFEPMPLYTVLGSKGYEHETVNEDGIWKIYFYQDSSKSIDEQKGKEVLKETLGSEEIVEIDVREMAPPEPMMKILETLPKIKNNTILLVHHHREPMMLYPKLEEKGYKAICNKIEENYYKVLISKKEISE